jgi:hypothetical protein
MRERSLKARKYRKIGGLLVTGAVFAAGIGFVTELSPSAARVADTVRAPAATAPVSGVSGQVEAANEKSSAALSAGLWPRAGERWVYRFERRVSVEYRNRPWLSLKMGGRATVEPQGMHGGNRFYLLRFEADRLELQGKAKNEVRKFPALRVEIDPAGKVRELRLALSGVEQGAPAEELKDTAKDLASQWLFFSDETRLGKTVPIFEVLSEKDGRRAIAKRIGAYPNRPELSRLDSTHEWVSASEAARGREWVERIEGAENFLVPSANGDFEQKTSYRWLWLQTELAPRLAEVELGEPLRIAENSEQEQASESAKRRIERAEFRETWAKLSDLPSLKRLAFFDRARRALDVGQGELVAEILAGVRGRPSTSYEWRTGVGILASSASPEAQQALLGLYRESGRRLDEKLSILAGLAAGEGKPAAEWKDVLATELKDGAVALETSVQSSATGDKTPAATAFTPKASDPAIAIREAALYALGSAIRKETDEPKRRDLEKVLWREISDARTVTAQLSVLEAIGNSASREFYDHIRTQARSQEPRVRAKAVSAVRFLASELAKPVLDSARQDPSPLVQKAVEWSRKYQDSAAADESL